MALITALATGWATAADPARPAAPRLAPRPIPGMANAAAATAVRRPPVAGVSNNASAEAPTVERARIVSIHRRGTLPQEENAVQPDTAKVTSAATVKPEAGSPAPLAPGQVRIIPHDEALKLLVQQKEMAQSQPR